MPGFCAAPSADLGLVQGLLISVDCNVQTMAEVGYRALSGPNSQVAPALTAMLTIYVAILGLRLLMGLTPLRVGDVTMTVIKLAVVLALATNWPTYQGLVFNTLFQGPQELGASVMSAMQTGGSSLGSDPFGGLQVAYDQFQLSAAYFARTGSIITSPLTGGAPFAAFSLTIASYLMILTTVGVVLAAKIVLGLLLALGPVFVALLLFDSTRGVFEGWLRASLAFAFMPLFATLSLVVQLVLIEPHLIALAEMRATNGTNLPAATALFLLSLICAGVSAAGIIGVGIIAVGFKLPWRTAAETAGASATGGAATTAAYVSPAPPTRQLSQPRVASIAAAAASMDRRDQRFIESHGPGRAAVGGRAEVFAGTARQTPLGQTHRRNAQPRHAASSARRDK